MLKYPEFVTICITILKEQNVWLNEQPNNKSEAIRFAIKELMEKQSKEEEANNKSYFREANNEGKVEQK